MVINEENPKQEKFILKGVLQSFDIKHDCMSRIYPAELFLKHLNDLETKQLKDKNKDK
jgi:DNA polymerase III psi subunit